jgi:hypothetical protein
MPSLTFSSCFSVITLRVIFVLRTITYIWPLVRVPLLKFSRSWSEYHHLRFIPAVPSAITFYPSCSQCNDLRLIPAVPSAITCVGSFLVGVPSLTFYPSWSLAFGRSLSEYDHLTFGPSSSAYDHVWALLVWRRPRLTKRRHFHLSCELYKPDSCHSAYFRPVTLFQTHSFVTHLQIQVLL